MLPLGFADGALDPQPVAHGGDFAERHARLHHPERAGIHAEEHDLFARGAEVLQIGLVRSPGIDERVIDMCDRRLERQPACLRAEPPGRCEECLGDR